MARYTVSVLDQTTGPIVTPSGSCADMLVNHLPELLPGDEAARRVSGRVRELTAFLVDDLGVAAGIARSDQTNLTYHPSCHGLRNLGLGPQAKALLDGTDGVNRCELPDAEECCGFGGLFSVELPEISAAIMERKLNNVKSSGADVLVGGDVSCLMHMGGGLHRRGSEIVVKHIAEVLAPE